MCNTGATTKPMSLLRGSQLELQPVPWSFSNDFYLHRQEKQSLCLTKTNMSKKSSRKARLCCLTALFNTAMSTRSLFYALGKRILIEGCGRERDVKNRWHQAFQKLSLRRRSFPAEDIPDLRGMLLFELLKKKVKRNVKVKGNMKDVF